jgi:hypothetical protein
MNIQSLKIKENKMKKFVSKRQSKKVDFAGDSLEITKLLVGDTKKIQEVVKSEEEGDGMEVIKTIIKLSVKEAEELSEDDWDNLALDDLTSLANDIMKFSGMDPSAGK